MNMTSYYKATSLSRSKGQLPGSHTVRNVVHNVIKLRVDLVTYKHSYIHSQSSMWSQTYVTSVQWDMTVLLILHLTFHAYYHLPVPTL